LPEANQYANENLPAEKAAKGSHLNLLKYLTKASKDWNKNFQLFKKITSKENFDIIIGDETYEIVVGLGKEPLIICAIGGTSIGKRLLELCGQAYQLLKDEIPDLQMVIACGPMLSPDFLNLPKGIEIKGYVPDLYEHFAASDLSIVQGGATSTLELTALNKTFLYFPIEGHFEQAHVAERLSRNQAGIRMSYSHTTPKILAEEIISNLGKEVNYIPIRTDGAQKSAMHIMKLF